jgi:ParB-like chromosome segregation protein Spo0J
MEEIMEIETIALDQLHQFEGNARKGDVSLIAESLFVNGQYKPIVVNRGTYTGKPNEILAGNHTAQAALSLGWQSIHVVYVDVDEASAAKIVIADNRTNDLASYDNDALLALIESVDDLDGTGWTDDSLAEFVASLNEEDEPDVELYDPPQEDKKTHTCPRCGEEF